MKKIIILIPVFNDWNSLFKLLEKINFEILNLEYKFSIIIINDASTENLKQTSLKFENISQIKIINMNKNKGQSRCNAAGLKYIFEKEDFDYVILMDGDGEDKPEEIKLFINKINHSSNLPIVGERIKRSESLIFKICYAMHKILTYALTGKSIKFGHFTLLNRDIVQKLINEKATWSNFSGSLTKISKRKIPIPSVRGKRYFDKSKMSYFNLILHSLSIISVFKITVLIRSLILIGIYIFFVYENVSFITIILIIFLIILIISIFTISKREDLNELNRSLENINNIETIK